FHDHRAITNPALKSIIQYREYITVQYLHICTKLDIASHWVFILLKIILPLLASSVIQLPRYLKRVTCSIGTLINVIHRCIPIGFVFSFTIITFIFVTLISIPYACMFYLVYLSYSVFFSLIC